MRASWQALGVFRLDDLEVPIVQAPLAGGPSTPELAAAVSGAGGLGFVAAGYKTGDALREEIARTRSITARPLGVNLFAPTGSPAEPEVVARYAESLGAEARRLGAELGEPRFDDDHFEAKLAIVLEERPAVVSFTFGCPETAVFDALHERGIAAWVTVTNPADAGEAASAGADALLAQGYEAGGHRGTFRDGGDQEDFGVLALLALLRAETGLPLVAAGGIATGAGVAAVLAAGAGAAALGTAFMLCPEAATSAPHRAALATGRPTGLTRAFTGRQARGIVNRLQAEHSDAAPIAYPEVHHVTARLRARAREAGDGEAVNLWAGQAHALTRAVPAAQLVADLMEEARTAAASLGRRLSG